CLDCLRRIPEWTHSKRNPGLARVWNRCGAGVHRVTRESGDQGGGSGRVGLRLEDLDLDRLAGGGEVGARLADCLAVDRLAHGGLLRVDVERLVAVGDLPRAEEEGLLLPEEL